MSIWDTYEDRLSAHGDNKRDASLKKEIRFVDRHLPDSLSHCFVNVFEQEHTYNIASEESLSYCARQSVAVINSDNLNQKTIISMPGDDIRLGSLIEWMGNIWMVYERDANSTLYTKAKMIQCNHLLKWITPEKQIIEQWCVVEDGTKYLTGELEDRHFIVTRGDARISLQISRNKYTVALNRKNRFLIDDDDSPHKLSYQLTKPLKRGLTYNDDGTFKFIMQEVTATEYDNHELGIADYYRYFDRDGNILNNNVDVQNDVEPTSNNDHNHDKKVWL